MDLGTPAPVAVRRNVEIKARVADPTALRERVARITDRRAVEIVQDDTFFACPSGRLKLRELSPTRGELIFYQRPDAGGPKVSSYVISKTSEPAALRDLLTASLGVTGRVRKQRSLFLAGRTRIHLDDVEGLGHFMELEVVLEDGEPVHAGEEVARNLMVQLGIATSDLGGGAYVDLPRAL